MTCTGTDRYDAVSFVAALFYLTDLYGSEDIPLSDPNPVQNLVRKEGKRPAIYLRFK